MKLLKWQLNIIGYFVCLMFSGLALANLILIKADKFNTSFELIMVLFITIIYVSFKLAITYFSHIIFQIPELIILFAVLLIKPSLLPIASIVFDCLIFFLIIRWFTSKEADKWFKKHLRKDDDK